MPFGLRRDTLPWWVTGSQAALLAGALQLRDTGWWLGAFTGIGLLGMWAWLGMLRRSHAILDTPTSRIASAAQGYVELEGLARPLQDARIVSPMTSLPCLWYRYALYRRVRDRWRLEEQGQSDLPFLLDDGTGLCEIDPKGAEILTSHTESRQIGDRRYTESVLLEGDRLYALGEFHTLGGSHHQFEPRNELDQLLTRWKADQAGLHARFDADGSGTIEAAEWEEARQAAEREVQRMQEAMRSEPARHSLRQPGHGRVYLISNLPPGELGRRYARWSQVHLLSLLLALFGMAWVLHQAG